MKRPILLSVAAGAWILSGVVIAHDVPNMAHTHAFKQTGYGTYRQGHSVNGPYGSITIYSPRTYTGYQNAPSVRFARPEPITRTPGRPIPKTEIIGDPAEDYGKRQKSHYGN